MVQRSYCSNLEARSSSLTPSGENWHCLEKSSNAQLDSPNTGTNIDNRRPVGIMAGRSVHVMIHPQTREFVEIDPEQTWFWTREWQALEREAEADINAGRYTVVDDIDAYFSNL